MKRISFLFLVLITSLTSSYAQVGVNYKSLEDKLAKSNAAIQDEKKAVLAKTWLDRAKTLQDIADAHSQYLRVGMSSVEAKIFFKEPKEMKTYPDGREEYVYDRFSMFFEGGKLKYWVETQPILPTALDDAAAAYKKAKELDTDSKLDKKITEGYKSLRSLHYKVALNYYSQEDFVSSYKSFDNFLKLGEVKGVSDKIDTAEIYYTGVTAQSAKMYDEALHYYNKAKELKYYKDPYLFASLKECYLAKGDSAAALQSLQDGLKVFPKNVVVLTELINYYLVKGEGEKALDYLQKAKDQDPGNKSYYFAEGTLLDKMGQVDNAVNAYKKAISIDSTYFDAYFNLGVLHFNNALKLTEVANNEPDNKKYAEKKKLADDEFLKVGPYMEKAYKIISSVPASSDPNANKATMDNKRSTLETLKTLYYRLKLNDQLERVNKLLQEL